jgi:phosphopantetheinyl transferase
LSIEPDARGRPIAHSRLEPGRSDLPVVSIAHAEEVAVAIAAVDPGARVGIDVARVVSRGESFERTAFDDGERRLLDAIDPRERDAWAARMWCAKEAAAKATGHALIAGPRSVVADSLDAASGVIGVRLGRELVAACPELGPGPFRVSTAVRDGYAWAWTLMEEGETP